jgi:hypothetical protein
MSDIVFEVYTAGVNPSDPTDIVFTEQGRFPTAAKARAFVKKEMQRFAWCISKVTRENVHTSDALTRMLAARREALAKKVA